MPSLIVDGEMQASVAFNKELMKENYPFCELVDKDVNTLIFPNLASGNIAYNLLKELGAADAIGPILLGLKNQFIFYNWEVQYAALLIWH